MWIRVFLAKHKGADEFCDHTAEKVPHLVTIFEHVYETHPLQLATTYLSQKQLS